MPCQIFRKWSCPGNQIENITVAYQLESNVCNHDLSSISLCPCRLFAGAEVLHNVLVLTGLKGLSLLLHQLDNERVCEVLVESENFQSVLLVIISSSGTPDNRTHSFTQCSTNTEIVYRLHHSF